MHPEGIRRRPLFVVLALLLLAALFTGASASAGLSPGAALHEYQKTVLDPQGADGVKVQPHVHTPGMSMLGMDMSAAAVALPAATGGQWNYDVPFTNNFNGIHVVSSPNSHKVLVVAGSGNNPDNFAAGSFRSIVWDTATNERREVVTPKDLFCSGHTLLPDGRALVVGGTAQYGNFQGTKTMYAFNFDTETYERLPDMAVGRWYPSVINGPDGHSLIVSGLDETGHVTTTTEVFDYNTNLTSVVPAPREFPLYPHIFLTSSGKYFYDGVPGGPQPGFWQPFNGNAYKPVNGLAVPGNRQAAASCFVGDVRNQNLMVMGGGWPGTTSTSIIKLNAAAPAFRDGPPLREGKGYVSCVTMPDGTLFEANGGSQNLVGSASTEAALLKNVSGQWTPMNPLPAGEHRLYHSQLFLRDDACVASMSSNPNDGPISTSLLIWCPPYSFKGTRPTIDVVPTQMSNGAVYDVQTTASAGATVPRITLTAADSPTHSTNVNQRYLSMPLTNGHITIPVSHNILPPGWYRMWAVDSAGRVSVATWVHLNG